MALFNKKNEMNGVNLAPADSITTRFDAARAIADRIIKDDIKDYIPKSDDSDWIWVKGYKGTDDDMCCHGGYQFELAKQFDMPEGAKIEACESGFHFCVHLKDVFDYYHVDAGNRFFEVRALVRKSDYAECRGAGLESSCNIRGLWSMPLYPEDKLAAKSIIFMRELTADEILRERIGEKELNNWTEEDKLTCIQKGTRAVYKKRDIRRLVEVGYSEPLADYIVNRTDRQELALALGSQPDLTKTDICYILFGNSVKR